MCKVFFPFFTKKYNSLDHKIRSLGIDDFKEKLSLQIKPQKFKHFSYGYSKRGNILLTRIRIGYSYLKAHSFSTGHSTTNICSNCNDKKQESSLHFIVVCPHFSHLRETLFNQMEQNFIPNFKKLSMNRQFEILVNGYETNNPEMKRINGKIMLLTQTFILNTKRFI